jgi:PAS domain-containing protein
LDNANARIVEMPTWLNKPFVPPRGTIVTGAGNVGAVQAAGGTADAAFTVTDQGEICSWNKAAVKLFGYSAEEVVNKTCGSVLEGLGPLGNEMCTLHEGNGMKGVIVVRPGTTRTYFAHVQPSSAVPRK